MMKIAGGWSSSSVAESYIASSKRTLLQISDGIGMNETSGYTVLPVSVAAVDRETSADMPMIEKMKKMRVNDTVSTNTTTNNVVAQNTYHFENFSGNFYITAPQAPAVPIAPATEERLFLRLPAKQL